MPDTNSAPLPAFRNTSIFFAPIWTDDFAAFVAALKKDARYRLLPKTAAPQYMLPYVNRIYRDGELFVEFELQEAFLPRLCMFESLLGLSASPVLEKVVLSCFSTGCIFAELHVSYEGLTLDEITDFAFHFKNAKKGKDEAAGTLTMEEALAALLPKQVAAELFFTGSDFKLECKMFHWICTEAALPEEELQRHLVHLRRGYHRNFAIPQMSGEYDMTYAPYSYDHWAGSQEGFVNMFHYTGEEATDAFLARYKPRHLSQNYRFMYLILLNQRFSAIRYLDKISQMSKYTRREKEKLNVKIFQLKTVFSFSVVSDDQLYQNLYSKMYGLLDIDRLLADIHDNEAQVETLQNHELLENEKMTSRFLFGLSLLSLFSVLVDAAGYFDRISILAKIATPLSFGCMLSIIVFYFVWWLRYRLK